VKLLLSHLEGIYSINSNKQNRIAERQLLICICLLWTDAM